VIINGAKVLRLGHYIALDYAPSAASGSRVRTDGPLFEFVAARGSDYRQALETIASYEADLASIPVHAVHQGEPAWLNEFVPGLDAAALYAFVRSRDPATYLEVGSGHSTRFVRRAIADGALSTRLVSIDPAPRADVDPLCDEIVRQPLERIQPTVLTGLCAGDVLFLDGSHRTFSGSDATVFFLDILPKLDPGILIGLHDVYLPDDYPAEIADRYYSEQYLLAALLLGDPGWINPVLASHYVSQRSEYNELGSLWARPELRGIETHGVGFWLETSSA
jgi:hypothetical protein